MGFLLKTVILTLEGLFSIFPKQKTMEWKKKCQKKHEFAFRILSPYINFYKMVKMSKSASLKVFIIYH